MPLATAATSRWSSTFPCGSTRGGRRRVRRGGGADWFWLTRVVHVAGDSPFRRPETDLSVRVHMDNPDRYSRPAASIGIVAAIVAPRPYGSCRPLTSPVRRSRGQGRRQRGRQGLGDRGRAVVCCADAEFGDPGGSVRLVHHLGDDHLRRAGPGGIRRGARATVMHDSGPPARTAPAGSPRRRRNSRPPRRSGRARTARGPTRRAALAHVSPPPRPPGPGLWARACCRVPHVPAEPQRPGTPPVRPGVGGRRAGSTRGSARRRGVVSPAMGEKRARRQQGPVAEDVVADIGHRWQADRRPVRVQRYGEHRVNARGVQVPQSAQLSVTPGGTGGTPSRAGDGRAFRRQFAYT
jgi:hypothetical protein